MIKNARVKVRRKLGAPLAKVVTVMVWKIEIAMMNDQLVGFLVRNKLSPDENVFKDFR